MVDPLGVLTSCAAVVASSEHVRIDADAVARVAADLALADNPPGWDTDLHYRATGPHGNERTAMWLMVLDTLNFCFWGQGDDPNERWRVEWKGELVDGYVALVAALTRAAERGVPLHDPGWLALVTSNDVADILAPADGHTEIPLFNERVNNLRELGQRMIKFGKRPATQFITEADHSAIELVRRIVEFLPSFNDVTKWTYAKTGLEDDEVRFYKRAQILAGDLAGGLAGTEPGRFDDLHMLTAFADYKVPQILREMDVLKYDDHLAGLVDTRQRLQPGSREEIEIRAATIIACDQIVSALRLDGREMTASELDWHLWSLSQDMPSNSRPYHLTTTIFY